MTKPVTRKMAVDCLLARFALAMDVGLPCSVCGEPLLPGQAIQFDHIHADVFEGAHEHMNLRPIHYDPCHKKKTKADIQAKSKGDRILGLTCNGPEPYVIRKSGSFYRPNRAGYTNHIEAAGIYTKEEAEREAAIEPHTMNAIPLSSFRAEIIRNFEQAKAMLELLNITTV